MTCSPAFDVFDSATDAPATATATTLIESALVLLGKLVQLALLLLAVQLSSHLPTAQA